MITLNAVRAAMLSDDPYTELDRLVRNELGVGRTTEQITDDFRPILDDALETSGLSDDGKESLLSTLDALTGNCHPDCEYKDPPNTTLPTEADIAELPRWARVAFAARCARRVFPFYRRDWPDAPDNQISAVLQAIGFAESAAETCSFHRGAQSRVIADAIAAAKALDSTHSMYLSRGGSSAAEAAARAAAMSPSEALSYAVYATDPLKHPVNEFLPDRSDRLTGRPIDIIPHLRRDLDHLATLAEWQKWDDDTPVPPEVFGPLWPEGPPTGWPPITDGPQRTELVIEAFARERATEQMIEDDIVNLFNALNRYHIARSGVRLTLEQFRSLLPAFVPAEV